MPQIDTSMNNDGDSFMSLWRSEEGIILITAPAVSMTAILSRCLGNTWKRWEQVKLKEIVCDVDVFVEVICRDV